MSLVTRRKHVIREMMEDNYELPKDNQKIVRVVRSPGNNLHEVETANVDDEHFLVSMPMKFRRNVWIKRGDCILVEPIEEGKKVKAEICKILTHEHIKEYTKADIWPERFAKKSNQNYDDAMNNRYSYVHTSSDSEADDLEPNMNRPMATRNVEEDSEEDDEEYTSSEEDY